MNATKLDNKEGDLPDDEDAASAIRLQVKECDLLKTQAETRKNRVQEGDVD